MILAGDIGGTKTRLALYERDARRLTLLACESYPSRAHPDLESILRIFLAARGARVEAAAFGIAGPVRDGRCETTNLAWVVDARHLAPVLGLAAVGLVNDLVANASGLAELGPDDLAVLNEGSPGAGGNSAMISAGTGLGEAGLVWDGRRHLPFDSEGGHASFAPTDEIEVAVYHYLRSRFGHVSWERVLSGPGLVNLYSFLRDTGQEEEPEWLRERLAQGDAAAAISEEAQEGRSALCARALDLFVRLYGAEAGNVALKFMATGGVYVGGGIAPKIIGRLRAPGFMERFADKGRMRRLLESMPVRVVLNDRTALLGAARLALDAASAG